MASPSPLINFTTLIIISEYFAVFPMWEVLVSSRRQVTVTDYEFIRVFLQSLQICFDGL
jgi:hypothetical protein